MKFSNNNNPIKIWAEGLNRYFFQRKHPNGQQRHDRMHNISNHQGNVSKKHSEISPHTYQIPTGQEKTTVGGDIVKSECLYNVGKKQISSAIWENSVEVHQKIKSRTVI